MITVVPYKETKGSERFKEFLTQPFTVDILYPVFNDKSKDTLFDEWRGKNMLNWSKFNNDEYTLEFYPTYYTVKKKLRFSEKISIYNICNDIEEKILSGNKSSVILK